jgi:DNA polymerase
MGILTIDFETYYDDEYSLSRMSAIEYVFDPRFEIIGVGIKRDDYLAQWYSFASEQEYAACLTDAGISQLAAAGHNMSEFDALIIWRLGLVPKQYICTLQLARLRGLSDLAGGSLAALCTHFGLPPKGDEVIYAKGKRRIDFDAAGLARYGAYCLNDVDRCYDLLMRMAEGVPPIEWRIMDLLTKCLARPRLVLDEDLLTQYAARLESEGETRLAALGVKSEDLSSSDRFAELLRGLGVDPPTKPSPTHPEKLIYAFAKSDQGMKELLEHDDEDVAALAAARLGVKSTIELTRTHRFLDTAKRMGGLMPMPQRYHGAHTGRGTGTMSMNVLNLSARKREPVLKKALRAPPGYVVVAGDSGQIEARLNAWNAGQDDLIAAFAAGRDVYREFAAESIYHVDLDAVDARQRQVAKSAVLGCGFMMGAARFREYVRIEAGLMLTTEEAQQVITAYRARYPFIANFWKVAKLVLQGMVTGQSFHFGRGDWLQSDADEKTVRLPSGRFLRYPGLHVEMVKRPGSDESQAAFVYERKQRRATRRVFVHPGLFTENLIQAIARDVVMWQKVKIAQRYEVVTSTYDEIAFIAPERDREEAVDFGRKAMLTAPEWLGAMPLKCDIGAGASYGEA